MQSGLLRFVFFFFVIFFHFFFLVIIVNCSDLSSHLFNVCTSIAMVTAIRKGSGWLEEICGGIMFTACFPPDYHNCISFKVINAAMHCIQQVPFMILLHSRISDTFFTAYHANSIAFFFLSLILSVFFNFHSFNKTYYYSCFMPHVSCHMISIHV